MINFFKKLFKIKDKTVSSEFTQVKTEQGEFQVETEDPILAEAIVKAWETGDTVIYENGVMKTIPKNSKDKK